ncbi:MAG: murein biosynthesis integral membrane protein MurJ [Planctomycetes bacterium]|nr:murein biosynthesis integral membrane protein MurJ [Planctomycetota bacterium]
MNEDAAASSGAEPVHEDVENGEADLTPEGIAADSVRLEEERRELKIESAGPSPAGRSVMGSAILVSGATFISRILGLARDVLMAFLFGISREMDVFFLAFTVPNLFRKLFGEGALSSATIPVLTRYRLRGDPEATRRLIGTLGTMLGLGLGAITLVVIAATWLVPADWFHDPAKYRLFREYLTILLPYVVFICLAALQAGTLNCWNRFGVPALMPALANLIWIGTLIYIWKSPLRHNEHDAMVFMAFGVLAAGMVQWGMQLVPLARMKLLSGPKLAINEPGIRETFKAMAPMLFALAVFQVNTFLDQVLAEVLVAGDGAVSSYSFASRLFQFPLGLVGVALGTAMFPLMSRFAARNEFEKLTAGLLNSARLIAFISLPAAFGLAALAYPITELLFSSPKTGQDLLQRSSLVATLLCISLPIVSVISLLTKTFYALRDYKTPTRIALLSVLVNIACNVILLQTPLLEAGLALGTAISGALNLVLLVWVLRRRLKGTILESMRAAAIPPASERLAQPFTPSLLRAFPVSLLRSLLVAALMGAGAWLVQNALYLEFGLTGRTSRLLSVFGGVLAGVVIYTGLSVLLRAQEVQQIMTLRKRR